MKYYIKTPQQYIWCDYRTASSFDFFDSILLLLLSRGISTSCCVSHKNRNHTIHHLLNGELNFLENHTSPFCNLLIYMLNKYIVTHEAIFYTVYIEKWSFTYVKKRISHQLNDRSMFERYRWQMTVRLYLNTDI